MTEADPRNDYFERRAAEEAEAAERAEDPRARTSHLELARRYSSAAREAPKAADDAEPDTRLLHDELRIIR